MPRSGPDGLHAPHTQDGPPQRASVSPTSALLALLPKPPAYKAVTPFLSLDSSADSSAAWAPDLCLGKQDPECSAPRVAPVGLNLLQLQDCLGLLRASCSPTILPSSQHSSCSTKAFPSSCWNPHHSKEPAPVPSLCSYSSHPELRYSPPLTGVGFVDGNF